jgi:hypothetical protein
MSMLVVKFQVRGFLTRAVKCFDNKLVLSRRIKPIAREGDYKDFGGYHLKRFLQALFPNKIKTVKAQVKVKTNQKDQRDQTGEKSLKDSRTK